MYDNPLSANTAGEWRRVDPRYKWLLRTYATIGHIALLAAMLFADTIFEITQNPVIPNVGALILAISCLLTCLIWAPRRARRLLYLQRTQDINVQQGLLLRKQMSMSMNRIQHLEVNQGPLQRLFGLATLSVYSAGSHGSDLQIPGLGLHKAHSIKSRLLEWINAEEPEPAHAD